MSHNSKKLPSYMLDLVVVGLDVYQSDVKVIFRSGRKPHMETMRRETITRFSKKSRQKLAFVAANTEVEFQSIITLTYPSEYPTDGRKVKRDLNLMLTRLRQRYASIDYLWFLEFQRRGAPHVHILVTSTANRTEQLWLSEAWYKVVGSKDPKHLLAGTQYSKVRVQDGAKRYAVKYAMKMRQKEVPVDYQNVGRFWGNSKNVAPKKMMETIPISDVDEYRKYLDGWSHEQALDKPMSVLYNAAITVANNHIDRIHGDV